MIFLVRCKKNILTSLSPLWSIYLRMRGVHVGTGFTCIGRPGLNLKHGSQIRLGNWVTLCNSAMANPVSEPGRCRLATVAAGAQLVIHDRVGMSSTLICFATRIEIGQGTLIGGGTNPLSPPSVPAQRRLQGPPAKSKFLAVMVRFLESNQPLLRYSKDKLFIS